jgi:hypothetical protein
VLASPVVHVEQADFISIPTRDVARAIASCSDVLGLPESEVSDGELETPNMTLSFWSNDQLAPPVRTTNSARSAVTLECSGMMLLICGGAGRQRRLGPAGVVSVGRVTSCRCGC